MLAILVGFVLLVAAEIFVIVLVAEATSPLLTIVLLVATSLLGSALVRREGARAWRRAQQAVAAGRPPSAEVADGALILLGGVLLVPPGFITDAVGLLLVLPVTRVPFRGLVRVLMVRRVVRRARSRTAPGTRFTRGGTVIQGEVVDISERGATDGSPDIVTDHNGSRPD